MNLHSGATKLPRRIIPSLVVAAILIAAVGNVPTKAHALQGACNCVIFRLDDIQDFWMVPVQSAVIDKFVERNESLDLAIIMNDIGNDPAIVGKVRDAIATGLIETTLHGWNHVDYRTLPLKEQQDTLEMANQKMEELFGSKTIVFVAPYNAYNEDTLKAASQAGVTILSAEFDQEMESIYNPDDPESKDNKVYKAVAGSDIKDQFGVYHLPQVVGYYTYDSEPPTKTPLSMIESQIDSTIASYGYAVVTLHPQDFAVKDASGNPTEALSESEMDDLGALITWVSDQGYHAGTFSSTVNASQLPAATADDNDAAASSNVIAPLAKALVPSISVGLGGAGAPG